MCDNTAQEEKTMAITEKELKKIKERFEKQNAKIIKLYRTSGNKALLEMLYLDSDNPEEVAEKFGISINLAVELVEKDKALKENPAAAMEEASRKDDGLYTKVFEFVASSGCEEPSVLAAEFGISEEEAESLLLEMKEKGDIASEDEKDSSEEAYDSEEETDAAFDFFENTDKIIEGICFLGDVIQDTSEKICDALDESVNRVLEHDFD